MVSGASGPRRIRTGIALSPTELCAADLRLRSPATRGWRTPLDPPAENGGGWPSLAVGLAELARTLGVSTGTLVVSLMPPLTEVRRLELPPLKGADLERLLSQAEQTTAMLEQARARRVAYIASLTRQRTLKARQITHLVAASQEIAARSETITADAGAVPAVPTAPQESAQDGTLTVSATGYSLPGHTATGMPVGWGVVAVDPAVIPLGTRLSIPGYGEGIAADVGSAVRGAAIDLWFPTLAQARAWGRRTVTVTVH